MDVQCSVVSRLTLNMAIVQFSRPHTRSSQKNKEFATYLHANTEPHLGGASGCHECRLHHQRCAATVNRPIFMVAATELHGERRQTTNAGAGEEDRSTRGFLRLVQYTAMGLVPTAVVTGVPIVGQMPVVVEDEHTKNKERSITHGAGQGWKWMRCRPAPQW